MREISIGDAPYFLATAAWVWFPTLISARILQACFGVNIMLWDFLPSSLKACFLFSLRVQISRLSSLLLVLIPSRWLTSSPVGSPKKALATSLWTWSQLTFLSGSLPKTSRSYPEFVICGLRTCSVSAFLTLPKLLASYLLWIVSLGMALQASFSIFNLLLLPPDTVGIHPPVGHRNH